MPSAPRTLRAETLPEPARTASLGLLRQYADTSIQLSSTIPGSSDERKTLAVSEGLQQQLWRLAAQALDAAPVASAPRLYVDSLNEAFDAQTVVVAARNNRVPSAVLALEVVAAASAMGLLAAYMSMFSRGVGTVLLASLLVTGLLLVTFDLDRPTRGLIRVPNTPLTDVRASMAPPPAAGAPSTP